MDLYEILGISRNATAEEIKKAYRKKAMESHPDRHWWDKQKEEEFKKINEAYAVLSDEQKKAHYDRFGSTEWMWWFGQWWFGGMDFDISDIFENFFGGGFSTWWRSGSKKQESWEDLEMNVALDFGEAIFGGKKTIKYSKKIICDECDWSWATKWSDIKTCPICHWSGQVRKRTQSFFGTIEQTSMCSNCGWSGKIIDNPCKKCGAKKRIAKEIEKEIEIPAGIDNWMTIKLKQEWNEWINGKHWDLYINFRVPSSFEWLTRDWINLHYKLIIDPVEAILWSKKKEKIPLLGERIIEIKSWTQNGDIIKFKWDWVKDITRDIKWDLFIKIDIRIPTNISKKERDLYEQIAWEKWINFADGKWIFGKIFG